MAAGSTLHEPAYAILAHMLLDGIDNVAAGSTLHEATVYALAHMLLDSLGDTAAGIYVFEPARSSSRAHAVG